MEEISIQDYNNKYLGDNKNFPGEHHFVSVYLLPKFDKIPDYVNPDGTKKECGDIGFKKDGKTVFSIEVKLGKTSFSFTKREIDSWFFSKTESKPDYLIALSPKYFFIIDWNDFHDLFSTICNTKKKNNPNTKYYTISCEKIFQSNKSSKKTIFINLSNKDVEEEIKKRIKTINGEIKKSLRNS